MMPVWRGSAERENMLISSFVDMEWISISDLLI